MHYEPSSQFEFEKLYYSKTNPNPKLNCNYYFQHESVLFIHYSRGAPFLNFFGFGVQWSIYRNSEYGAEISLGGPLQDDGPWQEEFCFNLQSRGHVLMVGP